MQNKYSKMRANTRLLNRPDSFRRINPAIPFGFMNHYPLTGHKPVRKGIELLIGMSFLFFVLSCVSPGKEVITAKQEKVGYSEYTKEPVFSEKHGIYGEPLTIEISSQTPGALITYTLDCFDPVDSDSVATKTSPVSVIIDPDSNSNGILPAVILRAYAHKNGLGPSHSVTQTYVFLNRIIELSPHEKTPGKLWPKQNKYAKGIQQIDYGMDPDVYKKPEYADDIETAFLQIPILSLVSDHRSFFDRTTGIYVNPEFHGKKWERAGSLELINADNGFRINAGIRIRGGWSRHKDFSKHAFRIFFRRAYGKGKLEYPLFEDEGTDRFDKIDLRTSMNYSWANKSDTGIYNTFLRDIFVRDLQGDMGQPYTRSRFYHLFLNGCYWGLYQTQERPEARYAATYFGGKVEDYDVIKVDMGENFDNFVIEATDGNLDAWQELFNLTFSGFKSDENYYKLEGINPQGQRNPDEKVLVDLDNLIDYMIIIFYTGNFDCPLSKFRGDSDPNNFYAIYNRNDKDKGFFFLIHDAEHTMFVDNVAVGSGLYENRVMVKSPVASFKKFNPQDLHNALVQNEKYRTRFNERVKKHFFNNGALTYDNNVTRFTCRMKQIDMAIIAESARWGDGEVFYPRTKAKWEWAVNQILDEFFPKRTDIVLKQLEAAGLYFPE